MPDEVLKAYAHHVPGADGRGAIAELRVAFSDLQRKINDLCPHSRERSTASTHLETAAMWAIKSVVLNDDESKVMPAGA